MSVSCQSRAEGAARIFSLGRLILHAAQSRSDKVCMGSSVLANSRLVARRASASMSGFPPCVCGAGNTMGFIPCAIAATDTSRAIDAITKNLEILDIYPPYNTARTAGILLINQLQEKISGTLIAVTATNLMKGLRGRARKAVWTGTMKRSCQKYAEYWLAASIFTNGPWELITWRNGTRSPMHIPKQTSSSHTRWEISNAWAPMLPCGMSTHAYHAIPASTPIASQVKPRRVGKFS